MKFKLTLEYNGAGFSGWQWQSNEILTIQSDLERALQVLLRTYSANKEIEFDFKLTGSGRTDRGVHAKGQVASFLWPDEFEVDLSRFRLELNGITSKDLSVRKIERVDSSFCARFTPHIKRYCYTIHNARYPAIINRDFVWWVTKELDFMSMKEASLYLIGKHDFSSFRASDCGAKTTIRTLSKIEIEKRDLDSLLFIFEGNGFLKNMIRTIVGTLVEVGRGSIPASELKSILEAKDRTLAGQTAPAQGLCLEYVDYERTTDFSGE